MKQKIKEMEDNCLKLHDEVEQAKAREIEARELNDNLRYVIKSQGEHITEFEQKLKEADRSMKSEVAKQLSDASDLIDSLLEQLNMSKFQRSQYETFKSRFQRNLNKSLEFKREEEQSKSKALLKDMLEKQECQICLEELLFSDNKLFSEYAENHPSIRNMLCRAENKDESTRRHALPCGHDLFHYKCIKKWFDCNEPSNRSCPICKAVIAKLE